MIDAIKIAESYIDLWNETNGGRRRDLYMSAWSAEATYVDPVMRGKGSVEIDALIAATQTRFPKARFKLIGKPDGHNDRVRFSWALGPSDEPDIARGTDIGIIGADGKIQHITGFLDFVAA
jgi:hypothetical protein